MPFLTYFFSLLFLILGVVEFPLQAAENRFQHQDLVNNIRRIGQDKGINPEQIEEFVEEYQRNPEQGSPSRFLIELGLIQRAGIDLGLAERIGFGIFFAQLKEEKNNNLNDGRIILPNDIAQPRVVARNLLNYFDREEGQAGMPIEENRLLDPLIRRISGLRFSGGGEQIATMNDIRNGIVPLVQGNGRRIIRRGRGGR